MEIPWTLMGLPWGTLGLGSAAPAVDIEEAAGLGSEGAAACRARPLAVVLAPAGRALHLAETSTGRGARVEAPYDTPGL